MSTTPSPAERRSPETFSIRSVWVASLNTYRFEWRSLLGLAAVIELPLVIAELTLHLSPSLRSMTVAGSLPGFLAVLLIYGSLSHHFFAGVLERVVAANRRGHDRPSVKEVLRGLPWMRLVIADLILTTGFVAGLALFVLPGLLVATWFALTLPLINLEGLTVRSAFARSYALVRGHSWRVAALGLAAFLLPQAILGSILRITAIGFALGDLVVHAAAAIALLPVASLPLVVATFDLVDLDNPCASKYPMTPQQPEGPP